MDKSGNTKRKKSSIDFNSILKAKSNKPKGEFVINLTAISSSLKNLKSLKVLFSKAAILFKRFKKIVYRKFFWGRGVYYRYSVIISILLISFPASVLASSFKTESYAATNLAGQVVDTAYDAGNGKTELPKNNTIESVQTYIVQKGDTVSTIAAKFDVTQDTITYANNLNEGSSLSIGQSLKILPASGILYKAQNGETLESIAKKFNITSQGYSAQVLLEINLLDTPELKANQELFVPGATIEKPKPTPVIVAQAPATARSAPASGRCGGSGQFISPTCGQGAISTCFSAIHPADDIASLSFIPLYASAAGRVTYAGYGLSGGSGIAVSIDHGNGFVTQYLHMSRLAVNVGDNVQQGQQIGWMGNTGYVTGGLGIHVHFIVKLNGNSVNPMNYATELRGYPADGSGGARNNCKY